ERRALPDRGRSAGKADSTSLRPGTPRGSSPHRVVGVRARPASRTFVGQRFRLHRRVRISPGWRGLADLFAGRPTPARIHSLRPGYMQEAILRAVNSHLSDGRLAEAKALLESAMERHPGFFLYWRKHAEVCGALVWAVESQQSLARSISLSPRLAAATRPEEDSAATTHAARLSLPEVMDLAQGIRFAGQFDRAPESTGRQLEGGRRLAGEFKSSREGLPLVTIVTVVFNNADTLERCISSVMAQDYANVEYVIVDGGSKAPTLDIIRKHAGVIDYFVSEPDRGIYDAMNKGIRLARGEYICLLNSDDYYQPDFVRRSVELALERQSPLVYSHYIHGAVETRTDGMNEGIFLGHLNINHSTFLVHRATYDLVGPYSVDYRIVSDAEWMRDAFARGVRFDLLDAASFVFAEDGLSSGGTEARRQLFISEVVSTYRKRFDFLSEKEA